MSAVAEHSFGVFYQANVGRLVALGWSLTGERESARDLAQYALAEASRRWDHVVTLDRPDLWVRRIVINRSASRFRSIDRERRAIERLGRPIHVDPTPLSDSTIDFLAAVRHLPRRQAQVVVLHYLEDCPVHEIAQVLGVSPGTVKTSLHRARATLARSMSSPRREASPAQSSQIATAATPTPQELN
jgi:RNA polymerase sigma-70 factor (ECF subfamily)